MPSIQFDVIMTSRSVEVLLYIEFSAEPRSISFLQPYKNLERFHDNSRNYSNLKKGPRFFETPCKHLFLPIFILIYNKNDDK